MQAQLFEAGAEPLRVDGCDGAACERSHRQSREESATGHEAIVVHRSGQRSRTPVEVRVICSLKRRGRIRSAERVEAHPSKSDLSRDFFQPDVRTAGAWMKGVRNVKPH